MFNKTKRIKKLEKEKSELQNDLLYRKLDETAYAAIFGHMIENQVTEIVKNKVSPYLELELSKIKKKKIQEEERFQKLSMIEKKDIWDIKNIESISQEIGWLNSRINFLERVQNDIIKIILNDLK